MSDVKMELCMESLKRGESGWGIGATEFAIGAAVFKTTEGLAKGVSSNDERNYAEELGWYWADDGSDDCSVNPNTRLCNDNVIQPLSASEVWKSIGEGTDVLETGRIDWESPHLDTLAAKGIVSLEDQLGANNEGKKPIGAVQEKMYDSSQRGNPDLDADVAVSYDFHAKKNLRGLADFRGTE